MPTPATNLPLPNAAESQLNAAGPVTAAQVDPLFVLRITHTGVRRQTWRGEPLKISSCR